MIDIKFHELSLEDALFQSVINDNILLQRNLGFTRNF